MRFIVDLINDQLDANIEVSDSKRQELILNYLQHLFYDQAFINYPYPLHNLLRETGNGIHRIKGFENAPITVITRYEDVAKFLRNPSVERPRRRPFTDRKHMYKSDPQQLIKQNAMLFLSGMEHKRLRDLVSSAFHKTVVKDLEKRIREICDILLCQIKEKPTFDFISDFGFPFPILVIMDLLGVPKEDIETVRVWSERMVKAFARVPIDQKTTQDVNEAIIDCKHYFYSLFDIKRDNPTNDLISELVQKEELSDEELFGTVMITLIAGHETTTNAISTLVLHLQREKFLMKRLIDNPKDRAKAIEEFLRFEPPFAFMTRFVHDDFNYKGIEFRKGDELYLHFAAANRDPRVIDQPDRIDIDRDKIAHFSFGRGNHYCLGSHLARLELEIVIDMVLPILNKYYVNSQSIRIKQTGEVRGVATMEFMSKSQ